jgi:uncharacterized ferritin-like protein (DUF455 family)
MVHLKNLYQEARHCLLLSDPDEKIAHSRELVAAWRAGTLEWKEGDTPDPIDTPGRPERPLLVSPNAVPKRGFFSETRRAALIHALTHIELTAVNLAWDSIYRYRQLPQEYYRDWVETAADESNHFLALRERLHAMGFDYGDFQAHNNLWQHAVDTGHDLMDRMAIVHRVLEARALDVVPRTLEKFRKIGDPETAAVLVEVANDEVGHVSAGSRWFHYRCAQEGLDPDSTFFALVQQYFGKYPKGPFNTEARSKAGFSANELALLKTYDEEQHGKRTEQGQKDYQI